MLSTGRAAAKAEHPEASVTEISRFAGALWRELSDEEKQPYVDEAAELKAAAASKAPAVCHASRHAVVHSFRRKFPLVEMFVPRQAKSRKRKASATPSAPVCCCVGAINDDVAWFAQISSM